MLAGPTTRECHIGSREPKQEAWGPLKGTGNPCGVCPRPHHWPPSLVLTWHRQIYIWQCLCKQGNAEAVLENRAR